MYSRYSEADIFWKLERGRQENGRKKYFHHFGVIEYTYLVNSLNLNIQIRKKRLNIFNTFWRNIVKNIKNIIQQLLTVNLIKLLKSQYPKLYQVWWE